MKKYTLTISILASNRKDTLPKTLESIKPILDNVSSELIIVDTGCDEDLLEIIRKYTDKRLSENIRTRLRSLHGAMTSQKRETWA